MADRPVRLDLNHPVFQKNWFALPKDERLALLATLDKLSRMTWDQVYRDKGLNWELIQTRTFSDGERIYSLRVTKKFRAVAQRRDDLLRFLSLHSDHDSAYQ